MNYLLRFTLCFGLVLLASGFLSSQEKMTISVPFEQQKISRNLFNEMIGYLQENVPNYTFENRYNNLGVISITPAIRKTGLKKIEGMESKNVGKATMIFTIKNEASEIDSVLKVDYSIAGTSEKQIDDALLNSIRNDKTLKGKIGGILDAFTSPSAADCEHNLNKVKELEAEGQYKSALLLAFKLEKTFKTCSSTISPIKLRIQSTYEKEVCEKLLYEAQILINSGNEVQMNKAVSVLLQIPPKAACKNEALALSNDLSNKMKSAKSIEKIAIYKNFIVGADTDWWYYYFNSID